MMSLKQYFSFLWFYLVGAVLSAIVGLMQGWGIYAWILLFIIFFPGLLKLFNFISTRKFLSQMAEMTIQDRERFLEGLDPELKEVLKKEFARSWNQRAQ